LGQRQNSSVPNLEVSTEPGQVQIDAKILIEDFRRQFNEVRPHSSLGNLTPAEFKRRLSTTNPEAISEA